MPPRQHVTVFGDCFGCHNWGGSTTGTQQVEGCCIAYDDAIIFMMKNYLAQNINNAEVKPY